MPSSYFCRKAEERMIGFGYFLGFGTLRGLLRWIILQLFEQVQLTINYQMSSIYYRRWTRMYAQPAFKYFHRYGVLTPGYQSMLHMMNHQNPGAENKRFAKRQRVNKDADINQKLIENLFRKYPDLKYESISRQKFDGDSFNSYSYAHGFITQQKKLIKAGYSLQKSFQQIQARFQDKIKRKMDQNLLSRGLAVGNRARSFLTIYQQQVQYESRLKMLRTHREVKKYENKIKQIEEAVEEVQPNEDNYERVFKKITDLSEADINNEYSEEKRGEMIGRIQSKFKNMFSQFYERAGYRDRLRGLSDQEIQNQIMTSPQKIKRQSRELIKFLKSKGDISISPSGDLRINDSLSEKLKSFIFSSPTIKIALLNDLIGYQSPHHSIQKSMSNQAKMKLRTLRNYDLRDMSPEVRDSIRENKRKELQLMVEKDIPQDYRAYTIFQSAEQRLLRLQIKYYESLIRNSEDSETNTLQKLQTVIEKFRRLKFRMEKRQKKQVTHQLAFPEHFALGESKDLEADAQFEDLLDYLRKRVEERRLKALDQVDDNKINEMIKDEPIGELTHGQGEK